MNDTEVNIPLLRKAVEWAEAEAEKPREIREWEQRLFVLPKTMSDPLTGSRAGDAAVYDWVAEYRRTFGKAEECGTCYCIAGYVASLGDEPWDYDSASDVAIRALGLSSADDLDLFEASNNIEDIRRIAERIAGETL